MTATHALLVDADRGSESAFRDLVAGYIDLVYSTALRKVGGDAHLAQDVTQTVFSVSLGKPAHCRETSCWETAARSHLQRGSDFEADRAPPTGAGTRGYGRQAQVQTLDEQVIAGVKQSLGPVIEIVPVISVDKCAIDLNLQAGINRRTAKAP